MNHDPYLSEEEIFKMTRYKIPSKQMKVLRELGVQAKLLRDNTVRVMRMHCFTPAQPSDRPKLKL